MAAGPGAPPVHLVLAGIAAVALGCWVGHVLLFPFIGCFWCGGNGTRRSSSRRRTFRRCWRCNGKGSYLRLTRRILSHYKIGRVPR